MSISWHIQEYPLRELMTLRVVEVVKYGYWLSISVPIAWSQTLPRKQALP
jgi:hypothetical protein